MNAKNKHIQFTAEKPDDYKNNNGNIPTLNFKVGISEENNEYILMFYEKPMASKLVTPADSAMGRTQRDQIVANYVTRMMRKMSPKLEDKETDEVVKVLDNANNKLKLSGYKFSERHHIIESGISFYMKRKQTAKENGEKMFQTKEEARKKRDKKKLGIKEIWFPLQVVKKKKELKKRTPWIHRSQRMKQTHPAPPPHKDENDDNITRPEGPRS